ncbi:Box C/D snoRNA protein 1 [Mortierella sp. AD031]|nr:Box C/D snoRNA protein 1 [Mortierella sp. AD031]KAG0210094.1 Box C/D snoRNA protein 1 [Mortierella sp. NVP41]
MDFFANAFVTRDVVDPENMVVKDGIHIREKALSSQGGTLAPPPLPSSSSPSSTSASASASALDIVNCEVCGVVAAKYKCPGCFCQTCSLACSKQHKLDTTCSGVRSRIHFVERKQYTEQDMMSDYNFLEEVGRTVDNAARENVKLEGGSNTNRKKIFGPNGVTIGNNKNNSRSRYNNNRNNRNNQQAEENVEEEDGDKSVAGLAQKAARDLERLGAEGSGSYRDKQLILQAKKRGTHLIMMADGLKKRKENNTNWKDKFNKLYWTIEWLFPEEGSTRRILEHKNDDIESLKDLLTGSLSKDENKDLAAKYPLDTLHQCRLYFVIPLRHANQPALYSLSTTDSLQEALKFKKVLEYPTILVLGPNTSTISNNDSRSNNTSASETPSTADQDTTTEALTSASTESSTTETAAAEAPSIDKEPIITSLDEKPTANPPVNPQIFDHTHPLLEKYTIEEPPTQWPKKPTPARNNNNGNNKRPNDTTEEAAAATEDSSNKKVKLESEVKEEDAEMSAASEDEDSSDDDSSDDDSSDDSSDDVVEDESVKEEEEEQEENPTKQEAADSDHAHLEIGQAILEAFNQDFGSAE